MSTYYYSHLIADDYDKITHLKEDRIFNKLSQEKWTPTCRRMKLDPSITLYNTKLQIDET